MAISKTNERDLHEWVVAIPVYNAIEVTDRAIDYLLHSGVNATQIVILDDGSTDPAWQLLLQKCERVGATYRRYEENVGYTKNINRAFEIEVEFIILINSDCLISLKEIKQLVQTAHDFPFLAGVGPLSNHAGSQSLTFKTQRSWIHFDNDEIYDLVNFLSPKMAYRFGKRPILTPSVNGFCAAWRRSAVLEVSGFDEINFERGYGEEDDLCYRLLSAGWFCAVAPWLLAIHFKTQSFSIHERNLRKVEATSMLKEIYGERFHHSVVNQFESHPLFRNIVLSPF